MPYFRQCFENIYKIEFDKETDLPKYMVSQEGEKVELLNYLQKGEDVEGWFKDLEDKMRHSLIKLI